MRKSVLFFFFCFYIFKAEAANSSLLILDVVNNDSLPKNFRTTQEVKKCADQDISIIGLAALNESGSGQFSRLQLNRLIQALPFNQPIIDVDLREESHGFLDGNAISWRGKNNWENRGKTASQIKVDETNALAHLKLFKEIKIGKFYAEDKEKALPYFNKIRVTSVLSEKELAQIYHIGYKRIYVTDRHRPTDKQVDEFIHFFQTLPPHTWLHFHCLAGKGRTTSFMVMYDMLQNAKQVTFDTILDRQAVLGGRNLKKLPLSSEKFYLCSLKRIEFLKKFYLYCRSNHDNFATSWTNWIAKESASKHS